MSGRTGELVSINRSSGGVPKRPVLVARVGALGLDDDEHVSPDHGGPDRAICIYSLDLIKTLREEGHPIDIGTAGENFTIQDVDWTVMEPGALVTAGGDVLLEIASFTSPCKSIAGSFLEGTFKRISQKVNPGWSRVYARVLAGGIVKPGDSITIE